MQKIYIFGIPQHGNLGDQAIAEATARFIEKFTDLKVVEIPMSRSLETVEEIRVLVESDDIIAWHGGGNIGTLWPNEEEVRLSVLPKFPDNKIVLFPQSIFFDHRDKQSLSRSKDVYNSLKSGIMFLREKVSLKFAKSEFPSIKSDLVPDMVFSLDYRTVNVERNGVITFFRSDKEKSVRDGDQRKIIALLDKKFKRLTQSDTVVDEPFESIDKRRKFLDRVFDEIASHELVVTDRLHGMIFAYITGTPCVVFENSYHKIRSTYDTWLKDCKFIRVINSSDELESAVEYVTKNSGQKHTIDLKESYESLLLALDSDKPGGLDRMSEQPLVSVVIPVYNVEKYLDACLDSVTGQSYENLEIVLVDDGSTDSSGDQCDKWAKKDSRIRVVHKKNEGLNYARRDGFKNSSGKFITFLDSDDAFHVDALEIALKNIIENKADAAVIGYEEFSDKDKIPFGRNEHTRGLHEKRIFSTKEDIVKYALLGNGGFSKSHFMTAWGKVYSRRVVELASWGKSNLRSYEDNFWTPQVLVKAHRIVLVNAQFYLYRRNERYGAMGETLGNRLVGNSFNGKPVGYLELVDLLYAFYGELAKEEDVSIDNELREARYVLMRWRLGNLIKAGLLGHENNLDYMKEILDEVDCRLSKLETATQGQQAEIARLNMELARFLGIKNTARRLAANTRRKILRKGK